MSQGLTESNENCVFYDEERNKQFEENERQKETLNDEAEREKETENVDVEDVEEREEETGNAEEEDEDAEREEETENTEEEDEEQESGDTGDDESDEYSASEVVSDIDNDVSEEEEDAQDNSVNEWDAVTDLTPELDACTLNESTFNIPIEDISPAGIFSLFVTDEIIDKMVTETNKYALKHIAEKQNNNEIKTKSRLLSWKATNNIEMRKFLGVLLAMGLNKVSHINDYWSKKSIYRNEYIVSVMTRDRFLLLLKFWHFCDDSSAIHNTNKLKKIHDLANMLNSRFQEVLTPGLENKCRVVIADNFYSSIELAEELLSQKTRYCGTLNSKRRGLPKEIVLLKLKKGEIKGAMNKNGVKVIKWVDKRQLLMISTLKEDKDVLVNTGKKNRKTNEDIKKAYMCLNV
ncbi:unnamed protein product [Parnassius apollo]|uniref:(apollo) hypothetical protein n=1 Tax=Parnassius apollo TaxID=110799 RepID=A0A8S3XVS3_PARAO|nr:unnamed protein product [Parnassius apollo]